MTKLPLFTFSSRTLRLSSSNGRAPCEEEGEATFLGGGGGGGGGEEGRRMSGREGRDNRKK